MPSRSLTVPATLDSLPEIAAFVQEAAEAAGLDRKARYRLRLAVDEIATNLVMHGAASSPLELRWECDDGALKLVLESAGDPFDPRKVPPPEDLHLPADQRRLGGLGIYLALSSVDDFAFERAGDRNRHVFVMNRPAAAGPDPGPRSG